MPLLIRIPIALLYRHGAYESGFGFALLVVLLNGSQAIMVSQSSRSVGTEEDRRQAAEDVQTSLRKENARQDALARESERKAGEIDAQYRLITDALPAQVSYVDPELRYVRVNRTHETWFGLKSSAIEGRTIDQVLREGAATVRACGAVDLLNGTLAIFRPRLTGKTRLEQRFRATKVLPCFEGEIRQVLNNFVGNALDAMPHGGLLKVRIQGTRSLTSRGEGLVFTISDTGTEMSHPTAESIFEAFFTTKGMNGTGLGLWVSKEIIDRHRGPGFRPFRLAAGHCTSPVHLRNC